MSILTKWPFSHEHFDRVRTLWSDLHLEHPDFYHRLINIGTTLPAANIKETEQTYQIDLAVPGIRKEDLKIRLDQQRLIVSHEGQMETADDVLSFTRQEFSFSQFKRVFALPEDANTGAVDARYLNGVLHVVIPKVDHTANSKALDIQIH